MRLRWFPGASSNFLTGAPRASGDAVGTVFRVSCGGLPGSTASRLGILNTMHRAVLRFHRSLRDTQDVTKLPQMSEPIHPGVRIGHVHLKVADLERALAFYCGVLGFQLTQRYGWQAAFISAGGYHHHIGLNSWESLGGSPPPAGSTGLFHLAILYPTRAALADALRRLMRARIPLDGASDHGVSEALYLRDPDQNGVELYWDRPEPDRPRAVDGTLEMVTLPLDLDGLLAEAPDDNPSR